MLEKEAVHKVIDPNLIDEGSGELVFVETLNTEYGLTNVHFRVPTSYLCFRDKFSKGHPAHITKTDEVYFQKDCDMTLLVRREDCTYIVWVEVKTRIKDAYNDAIFKFAGCYYKTKLLLDSFEIYDESHYKEVGLIVYAGNPPEPPKTAQSDNVNFVERKQKMIAPPKSKKQLLSDKYKPLVESGKIFTMLGSDFGANILSLKSKYVLSELPMMAVPVDYDKPIVDIDSILSQL